jgi:phage tail protein X
MAKYVTKVSDRLDRICDKYYGTANNGIVEFIIEHNYGLDLQAPLLPAGLTIDLPDRQIAPNPTATIQQIELWSTP